MFFITFLTVLFAALALSKPIEKRDYVTEDVIVTVTTIITEDATSASVVHHWHWPSSGSVTTSSVAVASPSTPSTSSISSTTSTPVEATSTSTTSTTSAEVASTTSAAASASASLNSYQTMILDQHNLHRVNHSASDLTWNDTLASIAQSIASTCVYAHNLSAGGGGYGQNIGAGAEPQDVGAMITDEMYNGEINWYPLPYGNNNPDMTNFEKWGHFSQIVWSVTETVGCATQQCSTLANVGDDVAPYFTVCNYYPAGNVEGEYSDVGAPLGEATVTV